MNSCNENLNARSTQKIHLTLPTLLRGGVSWSPPSGGAVLTPCGWCFFPILLLLGGLIFENAVVVQGVMTAELCSQTGL